ncbi:ANTAR domain-containing protein [Actinophytocola sp.]|uniref:GAF and ANTAR domain-containing protein n=1 Tax=Actinophytocola sp. TaxID=1872138 RepID=UPI002D7F8A81|nr:ANTAR domain-containing protein [Actinophytocola sp.]HET9138220.1 ANTAR domain-containing protein [Actinophytocola sp.]
MSAPQPHTTGETAGRMDQVPSDTELLDPAVQCLFAVSLDLHGALDLLERNQPGPARQRIWSAVGQLDDAITGIRDAAAQLITSGYGSGRRTLATFLATAAGLVGGSTLDEGLRMVLTCCVDLFPVAGAGIVLSRPPTLLASTPNGSAELLRRYRDGPDATPAARPRELDLTGGDWPELAAAAEPLGVTTLHTFPLRLREEVLGALVLPGAGLPAGAGAIVQGLADLASITILHEHAARHREEFVTQLEFALTNQAIIEQAKGTLAERHHTSGSDAFRLMTVHAQLRNLPVLEVARGVLDGSVDISA